jgi:hypothetical protein
MVRAAVDNDAGDANEATTPEARKIHNTTEDDLILSKSCFFERRSMHFVQQGLDCTVEDTRMHYHASVAASARWDAAGRGNCCCLLQTAGIIIMSLLDFLCACFTTLKHTDILFNIDQMKKNYY